MELPNRKSIRLPKYDYSSAGAYFITICTQNKKFLWGNIINGKMVLNNAGMMLQKIWLDIPIQLPNTNICKYIIMPNHFHAIIQIQNPVGAESISARPAESISARPAESISARPAESISDGNTKQRADMESAPTATNKISLSKIVQTFKRHSTIKYINMVKQNLLPPFDKRIWQRDYWEHIIRNNDEYNRITKYIITNPEKWDNDKLNNGHGNIIMEEHATYGQEEWMV